MRTVSTTITAASGPGKQSDAVARLTDQTAGGTIGSGFVDESKV
jgi:hypothetical protein